LNSF